MIKVTRPLALLAFATVLAIAGCGGGGGSATAGSANPSGGESREQKTQPQNPEPTSSEPAAIIDVATIPGLGEVLVDSAHKTLYYFNGDKRGSGTTHCYRACARIWYSKPSGTKPGVLSNAHEWLAGTIARRDGTVQATYNGWPLYTNIKEYGEETTHLGKKSFGGTWYALHPDGTRAGG